jgi:hypothetical protein
MEVRAGATPATGEVVISRHRLVVAFVAGVVVLNVLNLVSIAMGADTDRTKYFLLALERNPSTWFSALLLGLAGAFAWLIGRGRPDVRTWNLVAVIFMVLSLDEVATFHEWLGAVPLVPGIGSRGWAGAGLLLVAVVGWRLFRWVLALDAELRWSFLLGGAVFVAGAIGFEVLAGSWKEIHGDDWAYWAISTVEENLEMLGVAIVLRGLLDHVLRRPAGLTLRVAR